MKPILLFLIVLFSCLLPVQAVDEGIIVRLAKVYPEASSRKQSIAKVNAGTPVSIFSRKGGWKEIYSEKQQITGWVRSYQVRSGIGQTETQIKTESDDRGFLAGLASFSRKASGFFGGGKNSSSGNSQTATIGVRGLSEAQIKDAKPDLRELKKMQGFGSNKSRMANFASDGKLSSKKIKHLKKKK